MGDLRYDLKAPDVSRHFSQGLSFSTGRLVRAPVWAFGGKHVGEALPAQALSQYRILLCVFFSYLENYFGYQDIFILK